jgi:hypothetical protein
MKNFQANLALSHIIFCKTGIVSKSTSAQRSHLAIIIQSDSSIISSIFSIHSIFSIFEIIFIPVQLLSFKNFFKSIIFFLLLTKLRAIKSTLFFIQNKISCLSCSFNHGNFILIQGKFICLKLETV